MNGWRCGDNLLMLKQVDIRRENSDQQSDASPSRNSCGSGNQQTNSQDDFKGTAQINQLPMKRQKGRHNSQKEAWADEVHHTRKDQEK